MSGFTKGFGDYVCHGDRITCVVDGVTYTARLEHDADMGIEDMADYDEDILEAWRRDEWHFYGVVIDAEVDGWVKTDLASLWGVEGNYPGDAGNTYLLQTANMLLPEAIRLTNESLAHLYVEDRVNAKMQQLSGHIADLAREADRDRL